WGEADERGHRLRRPHVEAAKQGLARGGMSEGVHGTELDGDGLGERRERRAERERVAYDGRGVGLAGDPSDARGVRRRVAHDLLDEPVRGGDALVEGRVAVDLAEDAEAIAEPGVVGAEAGARVERVPPTRHRDGLTEGAGHV